MAHPPRSTRSLRRTHAVAARLRALSRSAEQRAAERVMVVEGPRLADEALREKAVIHEAVISSRFSQDPAHAELLARLGSSGISPWISDDATVAWLSDAATPQGILMLVARPAHTLASVVRASRAPLLLVACGVQDPGNMGSLVRLADAAGAGGLIAAGGADPFGPKAVRASAGSIFRLPVTRVERVEEAATVLSAVRAAGYTIAGAVARGGEDYRRALPPPPLALVLGGEAAGLPASVERLLDARLTIPINPRVESLNVAAAAAVLLFAAADSLRIPRGGSPPPARPGTKPPSRAERAASPSRSRGGGPSEG